MRRDIIVLVHGGPVAQPEDAEFILNNTKNCHGFYGASSMERLPVEVALTEQTRKFKRIGRGRDRPLRHSKEVMPRGGPTMSGQLIGALILWLIVAVVAIAIIVYLVNWLYRRSSKEVCVRPHRLVRREVVIDGGAFVLPIIHDITPVNMNVLQMEVVREKDDALITRDRMRVDIEAEFYVRVAPTREAVSVAAATLGRRTMEPERLHALLSGKFVSALRAVAAEMTHGGDAREARRLCPARQGRGRRGAGAKRSRCSNPSRITDLDQTDLQYFNPSNRFDAEGLTKLIEEIEERRKLRNDIEQDSMIRIRTRNLEAERQALDIERESETARLDQERDVEVRRAAQRAEVTRERALRETEAEQAQINAREEIEKSQNRQRESDQRSAHRLGARNPPARDRAHQDHRAGRNRRARGGREGADRHRKAP